MITRLDRKALYCYSVTTVVTCCIPFIKREDMVVVEGGILKKDKSINSPFPQLGPYFPRNNHSRSPLRIWNTRELDPLSKHLNILDSWRTQIHQRMNKSGTKTFSREQKRNCTKANLKLYDTSSNNVSEVRIKVALSTKYSHLGYKSQQKNLKKIED